MPLPYATDDTDRFESKLEIFISINADSGKRGIERLREETGHAAQFVEGLFEKATSGTLPRYGEDWTHFNNATSAICHIARVLASMATAAEEVSA